MRRLAFSLVLAVPLALIPAGSASAGSSTPSCSVKSSRTVVQNRFARVYTRASRREDEIRRLYSCWRRTGRKFLLDTSSDDGLSTSVAFSQVKLNRRFVAWQHVVTDFSCRAACPPDYDPTSEMIGVADARSRQKTGVPGNARAGSLAVNSRGTVTWIDDPSGESRTFSF